jgi:hypothetical protein
LALAQLVTAQGIAIFASGSCHTCGFDY